MTLYKHVIVRINSTRCLRAFFGAFPSGNDECHWPGPTSEIIIVVVKLFMVF